MNNNSLIPTPIVDKNGVASTRNKKALGGSAGSASLKTVRPVIGNAPGRETVHLIKVKALDSDSAVLNFTSKDDGSKSVLNKSVNVPDDVIYDFLRLGIDANEAAAFVALGMSPEEVSDDPRFGGLRRRNLNKILKSSTVYTLNRSEAIERLQDAGVSAVIASKVISNGLQDEHLDRALTDSQLVQLFSKWKFRGASELYKQGSVKADDIIESMLDGKLPFSCMEHKIPDIERIDNELRFHEEDPVYGEMRIAPEYFAKLVHKAVSGVSGNRPLMELHKLVETFGPETFDLKYPQIADFAGVEGARYIEQAFDIAEERDESWSFMSSGATSSFGGMRVGKKYLRNHELMDLHGIGVSPEEAYTLLIEKELTLDQIKIMKRDNIASSIADGIL